MHIQGQHSFHKQEGADAKGAKVYEQDKERMRPEDTEKGRLQKLKLLKIRICRGTH